MRVTTLLATLGYAFLLSPLAVVTVLSFSSGQYLTFPPPGVSLRWYAALLASGPVLDAAGKSVLLALLVTLVAVLTGFPAALAVARGGAPAWVAGALSLPLLLPTLVIGLALLMVLQPLGLLATWPGLALGHLMVVLPFVVRLLVTAFSTLPADLEDAAATLGARPLAAFLFVTLPLAAPGAVAAATLAFLLSFDETVISLFLVGPRLTTLPVTLFHYAESRVDPMLAALAVTLIVLTLGIVLVVDRLVGVTRALGRA
jgi:putative spermidine/putrescine transport system permease protein